MAGPTLIAIEVPADSETSPWTVHSSGEAAVPIIAGSLVSLASRNGEINFRRFSIGPAAT